MRLNFRKYRKVKRKSDFLEPEEVLFNKEALSRLGPDENIQRLEVEVGRWGIRSISYLLSLFLLISIGTVFYLGIIKGDYFKASAERNSLKYISIPAERGLIYDRNGKPLLYNKPVFDLIFFPNYLPTDAVKRQEVLKKIEDTLKIPSQELEAGINNPEFFLRSWVLKPDLTSQEAIVLESYFGGTAAVQVIRQNVRQYEEPFVFSHLLGYLGRVSSVDLEKDPDLLDFERIGKVGIEAVYEKELRGQPGQITILRNAAMEILGQSYGEQPKNGNNLYLTIDKEFQEYLYNRLRSQISGLGGERGGLAIAIDSKSGAVLALVSYPGFNANSFSEGISQEDFNALLNSKSKPLFNRTVTGLYNPGSTIKPIMAAAGLEEGIMDPNKKIETHGSISIPNPYNPDHPSVFVDWKNHGSVNMFDAIARSSNVYFYTLGGGFGDIAGLGISRIDSYLKKFGFDELSGIDLTNEDVGFIPSPENKKGDIWRIGDTYHVSIGQGDLLVTPLRLLIDLNSLVNGGKIMKPYLLQSISDADGEIIKESKPEALLENFLKPETVATLKKAMTQTVSSPQGTGYSLSGLPFTSGGKSGTAQIEANTKVNALFFAFAPADQPKISLLVLIENAREGSLNAIPVVKDGLLWYYQNRGL
ncbi:MAG TPA: penicillin-binding protein 2 [Candidatus Paceibacterota bacterium]|nr:penicillin-binding protein 2 [Candidatus Paceibacterota bacterium]